MSTQKINKFDSSPKAKGTRLKRVRNLANLTRRDIETKYQINVETLKGWEVGRHTGLSLKGAEKIVQLLATEGVQVTVLWLLEGSGSQPQLITPNNNTNPKSEEDKIHTELSLLSEHYADIISFIVTDDGMEPGYKKGDYVAGVKYYAMNIDKFIGTDCIIELDTNKKLLRHIQKKNANNTFILVCNNPHTSADNPVIYNAKIISAAPIIWQRRCLPK